MLPSASSAGSALSAAIAGVSPFATRRSSRTTAAADDQQHAHPPPTGSDSCFGVRSLDGSASWSEVDDDAAEHSLVSRSPESNSGSASEPTSDDDDVDNNQASKDNGKMASTTEHLAEALESRIHADASPSMTGLPPVPPPNVRHASTGSNQTAASRTSTTTPPATMTSSMTEADRATPHLIPPVHTTGMLASPGHHHPRRSYTPSSSPVIPQSPSPARSRRNGGEIVPPPPIIQHALLDMLADAPSEPSSPASLTSLVASMSSLSRMSSPTEWDWRHPLSRSVATVDSHSDRDRHSAAEEYPHVGSAELVLPTLALPSTSLHLGLERWNAPGQGTRIALIASPERARDVLGVFAARRPCVQLPRGEVGVLTSSATGASLSGAGDVSVTSSLPPTIQATIVPCLTAEHIRERASNAYANLHALLNPSPNRQQQAGLEPMVAAYASSKEWVHLAVLLDDAVADGTEIDIVPCTTLEEAAAQEQITSQSDAEMPSSASMSPSSSLSLGSSSDARTPRSASGESLEDLRIQDTPRPMLDTLEPWSVGAAADNHQYHHDVEHSIHDSLLEFHGDFDHADPLDPVFGTVALLERIIDDPTRVHAASTASFFEWRPSPLPDIASPITGASTSPSSSTFEGAGPMPTVARAQGGGEWEATLSRRLAHRRELDAEASTHRGNRPRGRGRGARRRRSHSPPNKPPCPNPIFPRRPIASSVGLVDLLDAAFAPIRRLTRTPWGKVMVACAIAIAVGCGIWAVRVQA